MSPRGGPQDSLRSFRNVTAGAPSIVAGSPITSGPSLADQLLLYVRLCVCSGSSFFGSSSIRTRPLLIVTHRGVSTGCRESSWSKHISSFLRLQPQFDNPADSFGTRQFTASFMEVSVEMVLASFRALRPTTTLKKSLRTLSDTEQMQRNKAP
jgi:hypothetical protein